VVLKIAYGHSVTSVDDEYVRLADLAAERTAKYNTAGSVLVDMIPARTNCRTSFTRLASHYNFSVRYIPTWLPGAGFKREAISISEDVNAMLTAPFEMVKSQMASWTCTTSPCSSK
jgi:hypothetical protein